MLCQALEEEEELGTRMNSLAVGEEASVIFIYSEGY